MIKKFEIKSHDGPGRIGKVDGKLTPRLFSRDELKIAPSEGSAYNIDREIAEFNVRETIRLAEENVDESDIAVIQGSKYIDLRIECLKKLEEIGYNGFIIANGDSLLTNSRDLVELVVTLKKEAKETINNLRDTLREKGSEIKEGTRKLLVEQLERLENALKQAEEAAEESVGNVPDDQDIQA